MWVQPIAPTLGRGSRVPASLEICRSGQFLRRIHQRRRPVRVPRPQGDLVGPTAQANQWTNVAVVQDAVAGLRYMYINGVKQPNTAPAQAGDGKGDFWIGQSNSSNQQGYQGYMDEVRLYNTAITPSVIQDNLSDPILSAVSLQVQGSNTFPINLLPAIVPQTEPRMPATPGTYTLKIQFAAPVTTTVSATLGLQAGVSGSATGNVGTISLDTAGTVMTVPLTNVANAQALNLHLTNVGTSTSTPGVQDVPFNIFEGDVSGDHIVDASDAAAVSKHYNGNGTTTSAATTQYDVNCDGIVNATDVSLVTSLAKSTFAPTVDTNLAVFKAASASSVSTQNTGNVPQTQSITRPTRHGKAPRPSSGSATTVSAASILRRSRSTRPGRYR